MFRLAAGTGALALLTAVTIGAFTVTIVAVEDARTHTSIAAPGPSDGQSTPSPDAVADIPADTLVLYRQAASDCPGLDWTILAGIGKVETDHGRSRLPGVTDGENSAGAAGPMQFLQATFDSVTAHHALPAGGASPPSRYNPSDAIHAAAYYLCDSGAPSDLHRALYAYNHADWYVQLVLDHAARYRATPAPGSGDCRTIQAANPAVVQVISFACAQLGQPYVWGGNGPEASGGWDCSGLTKAAYATIGIDLPRTTYDQVHTGRRIPANAIEPGDLLFFGTADDVHHVGLYLGDGKMIHAPDFGIPVRIDNSHQGVFYAATRPSPTNSPAAGPQD
ncbi:bifunctional lytic transglycosylase/C40 family peptidase [Nocardia wallacei]|uniref:C40 family peptidase n=1 Tax=Nocardia wallacei TaxID=480035 RepID=UPI00245860C1|nr:bifunctional lytic transglycosylase/C40 family peptidase [Nocardia wallacei]